MLVTQRNTSVCHTINDNLLKAVEYWIPIRSLDRKLGIYITFIMLTYYVKINFLLLLSFKEIGYQLERGSHQRDSGGPSLNITLNTFAFKFPRCRHSITTQSPGFRSKRG